MTYGEKLNWFVDGLRLAVRAEVAMSLIETFKEASKIASNIDSVIWRAQGMGSSDYRSSMNNHKDSDPTSMELGSLQRKRSPLTSQQREQRKKDMENGACFKCLKLGSWPWKHCSHSVNNLFHETGTENDMIAQDEVHTEMEREN